MDDAQAIETLRELEDKGTVIFLREYADRLDLKGHPVHASELRKLLDALPALSVVEAQLAEGREHGNLPGLVAAAAGACGLHVCREARDA